jgi:hypothetical protein
MCVNRWRSLSPDRSLGRDHGKRLQVWPALGGVQTFKLVEEIAATHFDPAMILLDDFVELVGCLAWRRLKRTKEIVDRFGQLGLIAFRYEDLIRSPVANGLRNVRLRAHHGINGDDTAIQRHGRQ